MQRFVVQNIFISALVFLVKVPLPTLERINEFRNDVALLVTNSKRFKEMFFSSY